MPFLQNFTQPIPKLIEQAQTPMKEFDGINPLIDEESSQTFSIDEAKNKGANSNTTIPICQDDSQSTNIVVVSHSMRPDTSKKNREDTY